MTYCFKGKIERLWGACDTLYWLSTGDPGVFETVWFGQSKG